MSISACRTSDYETIRTCAAEIANVHGAAIRRVGAVMTAVTTPLPVNEAPYPVMLSGTQ